MIACSIIGSIGQFLLVAFVICGVVGVLLAIHCGSEFLKRSQSRESQEEMLMKLRGEYRKRDGISTHNVLYKFFFREE